MTLATFNAVTARALSRALRSLSDSSSLSVSAGALEWRADRLNSPYLSHQTVGVAMSDAHITRSSYAVPGVTLTNGRYTVHARPLGLSETPPAPAGMEWHEALVPQAVISGALTRLAAIAPGLDAEVRAALGNRAAPLVTAAVLLPAVAGWTEDGRPVYAEPESEPAADEPPPGIQEAYVTPDDGEEAAHHAA